jgi:hypothetical protein
MVNACVREDTMKDMSSPHTVLQGLLECYLETRPDELLRQWADTGWKSGGNVDIDETCLKYIALVLLDGIESRAEKIILEMGCPALVVAGKERHMLPPAPESMLARGLELVRDMCGLEGARGKGILCLGIKNDSIEILIEKSEALHILHLPQW